MANANDQPSNQNDMTSILRDLRTDIAAHGEEPPPWVTGCSPVRRSSD
ncbi:MAG TPA: hypothetical protein VGM23_10375 [Armatimonadota bacterium]